MPERVLVLDGNQRSALAVTRSLGHRGIPVVVAEQTARSLAGSSRFCARSVVTPPPGSAPDAFVRAVTELVRREAIDVVLPMTDTTTALLLRHREAVGAAVLPFPSLDVYNQLAQKQRLLELARSLSIAVPVTQVLHTAEERLELFERVRFPAVIKPVFSKVDLGGRWLSVPVEYARDRDELERKVMANPCLGKVPLLIQQQIVGPGHGVFALMDHGRPLALFAHRRLRERPPTGGVSVLCESVAPLPASERAALALLQKVGWHGVAMVEFKLQNDIPYLMEVNGRFWGSLQLAVDAGVDFPWLLYRLAVGQPVEVSGTWRVGVRSRWLLGDLDSLYWRWFRSDGLYTVGENVRATADFLRFCGDARFEVNRWRDFRPFLREMGEYLNSNVFGNRYFVALKSRVERIFPSAPS